MLSVLKGFLSSDQGLVDDREALFTFIVPSIDGLGVVLPEGQWGFFAPSFVPWKILALVVLIQSFIQCIFAVIIYYLIIQRRGSMEAYLIGWGGIVPASLYIPFHLLEALELQNRVVNLSMSTVMSVVFFRCIEAMYGTSPPFVENSLSNYVAYYSAIVPYVWDPKTQCRQRISFAKLQSVFWEIAVAFSGVSLLLSFLRYHDYRPFPSHVPFDHYEWTWEVFSFNHIANSYLHAWLIYGTLKTGFELSAFNENIKGFDTYRLFDQPFTKSRTPTEFWTQRWNMLTRPLLKGGVFLPMRKYFSSKVSLFCTFVASGLYHDYVWYCIFYDLRQEEDGTTTTSCRHTPGVICHDHQFGRVTLFFAYVGMMMLLERPVAKLPPIQWMEQRLPTPVIAHLLLLLALPFAYWYYGDWIAGGYFDHFAVALWQIKKL